MTEYLAIRGSHISDLSFNQYQYVRDALMFEKTAIINLENSKKLIKEFYSKAYGISFVTDVIKGLELLEQKGLIYQPDIESELTKTKDLAIKKRAIQILNEKDICGLKNINYQSINGQNSPNLKFVSNASEERSLNLLLNAQEDKVSTLLLDTFTGVTDINSNKTNAVHFIFKNFPFPEEFNSIEQVINFKKEGKSGLQYLRLKDFINKISRENMSKSELEDRLMLLIKESERDFKQFDMKVTNSNLKIISTVGVNFLNNIINNQYLKAVNNIIGIKEFKVKSSIEENLVIDKDISYMNSIERTFK